MDWNCLKEIIVVTKDLVVPHVMLYKDNDQLSIDNHGNCIIILIFMCMPVARKKHRADCAITFRGNLKGAEGVQNRDGNPNKLDTQTC